MKLDSISIISVEEEGSHKRKDITPLPHPPLPLQNVVFSMRGKL